MTPVRLRQRARRDLAEAIAWYRERNNDVAARLAAEVRQTLQHLEHFPDTGGRVPGVDDADLRQLPVHNFPYSIVFIRFSTHVSVLAIAHKRRRPGYWRQ